MNNKTLLGVAIAALVIIGGVVLLKGKSSTNTQTAMTATVQPTAVTPPAQTVSPTGENITATQMKATAPAKEVTVTVTSSGFDPATVTISTGTKVTWINKSGERANVSSDKHPTHLLYPPLNLGSFNDGESVSLVFDKVGTFTYHNHLDPSMTGEVVVQ